MIQGMIGDMFGMPVFSNPHLPRFKVIQFRFPKSKSKRIRNKWAKRPENSKQVLLRSAYIFNGNNLIVHPDDFEKIRHMVRENRMLHHENFIGRL